ncbi:DUF4238 domain-containing protein [Runella sp. CRIBMP]|uniref:DUF4238 domain-containing protein n=1 Tax=Runella sp. CRIBMP TaxID=2683261 RepID=UPI001413136E|nr:DUF4238 domain-containing protein [Runella sp. CRIBMP]NBB23428.1 DUF4238 domain-containing protein [Runella sp. CRIBMP]
MSTTKNHHFVPKGYLRQFGIGTKNDLYLWKIDLSKPNLRPQKSSIGKDLCSEKDFYRINPQESFIAYSIGNDPNIVEDKGFPYENDLPKILKKLTEKGVYSQTLSWKDTKIFIFALISIKYRNPFTRGAYETGIHVVESNRSSAYELIDEIMAKVSPQETQLFNHANELYKKFEYDMNNPHELLKTLHSGAFQMGDDRGSLMDKFKNLGNHLLNAKWEIIRTNSNHQFIISDNPGIFLSKHNIWSLVFENFENHGIDRFFFPLSPLNGLLIHLGKKDNNLYEGADKIIPVLWAPHRVREYNICHCSHANKLLIGSSEKALIEAATEGKSDWINITTMFENDKKRLNS